MFAYTTFELGTTIIEPSSKCAKMHLFAIYLAFLRYVKHFENTHPNQNITDEMIKPRLKIQPLLEASLNVETRKKPSAIDSESIQPLSVLRSGLKRE